MVMTWHVAIFVGITYDGVAPREAQVFDGSGTHCLASKLDGLTLECLSKPCVVYIYFLLYFVQLFLG